MFVTLLQKALTNSNNISITENGAIGYSTTGQKILDLNFKVPFLRGLCSEELVNEFVEAYLEEPVVATIWLFYARDIREGLGERKIFRACLPFIASKLPKDKIKDFIQIIPEYGRYDDLFVLLENGYKTQVIDFIKEQLRVDMINCQNNKPISLLAKWLKSENTSSKDSRRLAHIIRESLDLSHKAYRKLLSHLRNYLDITEVKMSANKFSEIDYEKVPSRASLLYKDAFQRRDRERYNSFIESANKGEVKINASVLYPHEIVAKYRKEYKENLSLEALWKNLPNLVKNDSKTLVVADGSGSMTCTFPVSKSNVQALDIANGLALYFAQRAKGPYRNTYITFSQHPQFVRVGSGSLYRDLQIALKHDEVANTNIEGVFQLILNTALENKVSQEDLPDNILIISDMEFDACACCNEYSYPRTGALNEALFDSIKKRFENASLNLLECKQQNKYNPGKRK